MSNKTIGNHITFDLTNHGYLFNLRDLPIKFSENRDLFKIWVDLNSFINSNVKLHTGYFALTFSCYIEDDDEEL